MKNLKTALVDLIYPVGSYYFSNSSTSPATLFGGTWTAVTGRFLYMNAGTTTGGSNTHTLSNNELPYTDAWWGIRGRNDSFPYIAGTGGYATVGIYNGSCYGLYANTYMGAGHPSIGFAFGGSQPHNNMPAYKEVCAWYRTK